jgi:diguanylate cyclase (GGDEF)-like protein/PAS domain S-box-containing protein
MGRFEMCPDGGMVTSEGFSQLCGLPPGEEIDSFSSLLTRVPVEERAGLYGTLSAPLGAGSFVELDFHLIRADGEMLRVALHGEWLATGAGRRLEAIVVERPLDEARRLSDMAERYRTLTEVTPDIIVVHQEGKIVYANPAALTTLRASQVSEIVGHPILDFFTEKSRDAFLARVAAMKQTADIAAFFEEQIVALDGTVVDIEATSIPTQWNGRPAFQAVARVITDRKQAERQLRNQAALIETVSDAIIAHEGNAPGELRISSWSRSAEAIYGWAEEEVLGNSAGQLITTDDQLWQRAWPQLLDSGVASFEATHRRKDGTTFPTHVSATLTRDEAGRPSGLITVATDISRRVAAENAKREIEAHYSAVVAALEEGIVVIGPDHKVQAVNAAAERILEVSAAEVVGISLSEAPWRIVDEDRRELPPERKAALGTLNTGQTQKNVIVGLLRGDNLTWLSVNSVPLAANARGERVSVCSMSDITAAKEAQDSLAHSATHDALTHLPNRAGITEQLYQMAVADIEDLSVLFIDVDHFKEINDSLGHAAGDQLLRTIAERISSSVRQTSEVIGRLAGDEFVVLCPNLRDPQSAEGLAGRLLEAVRQPCTLTDGAGTSHTVAVTASIGVAHLRGNESPEDVLIDADVAMYSAKENGRAGICVFDEQLRYRARHRMEVREELARALECGGLRLEYQPIVNPRGQVFGYEALVRWDHPERGALDPYEFIPIAEDSGLILPLGAWVLNEAATVAARCHEGGRRLQMSVNLSARQIADPGLLTMAKDIIDTTGVDPGLLCLEITESSVMRDAEAAADILGALKSLGVKLAIDDFGTGYSSLAYLDQFPVDALKIDRSFVSMLEEGAARSTLIAGIISLGRSLNLSVIAEGVETPFQARTLVDLKVNALQGYLYGRPGPLR